jgi:hypothetical protein
MERRTAYPNLIQFEARKRQFEEELVFRLARASLRPDKNRHRGGPARVASPNCCNFAGSVRRAA